MITSPITHPSRSVDSTAQWVYLFGGERTDGNATMRDVLGGKGANLAEMSRLGLPVPPGFTISADLSTDSQAADGHYPDGLRQQVDAALEHIADLTGKRFGDHDAPLLLSVRSGARESMPGMLDTILNIGLNDTLVETLAGDHNSEQLYFARDSYSRLIAMYGNVVFGIPAERFEEQRDDYYQRLDLDYHCPLPPDALADLIDSYKAVIIDETGSPFPEKITDQLWGAIAAVFKSWHNPRAQTYRKLNNIPQSLGTAVTVQAMVFGNRGAKSATGVLFTRNPANGENHLYGEYLPNAQGEDIVAGTRTPYPLIASDDPAMPALTTTMPQAYAMLVRLCHQLEQHYQDMQDIEFTIEEGHLWLLQTRNGKRSAQAGIRIAVDMAQQGLITREQAILRIRPASLEQLLHPVLDPKAPRRIIATGLPASPGAAWGRIVFDSQTAERLNGEGEQIILVREETSPEDIHGMHAAAGILTLRGGMTSHAAVVARGMGRPCVCGVGDLRIDAANKTLIAADMVLKYGDLITLDGNDGSIMAGRTATQAPQWPSTFQTFMSWVDETRRMRVRANAETPQDAKTAREFGAEGIGLCRTEHMFFAPERIALMRRVILTEDDADRQRLLNQLMPMQRDDFSQLFAIMSDLPVTVRLLDPPLHEFLPRENDALEDLAEAMAITPLALKQRISELAEVNPMLGHRGCRLGLIYPEIYAMQVHALFAAAAACEKAPLLEIMIPLVCDEGELTTLADYIAAIAKQYDPCPAYRLGVMIELPRAALCAGALAGRAEFFSFGTNDLTQTVYGLSRDDAGRFLNHYIDAGIFSVDPFVTLDRQGVGELISLAAERGRARRATIKLGLCGEHGGDPDSIAFCEQIGLDYVSCSPYRVPIARLAAAQASLQNLNAPPPS